MYRAKLSRCVPSIVFRLFTSKRYLLLLEYSSAFDISLPKYSMMRSPFLYSSVAKSPSPALDRFTRSPSGLIAFLFFVDIRLYCIL